MLKKVLTIAGSDTSAGAGMQADLKTFQEHDCYGMVALTTIVTMNPSNWNHQVFPIDTEILKSQLQTIESIGVDAMKTGMLGSVETIEIIAEAIERNNWTKTVIDPVLVCKGENDVLHPETAEALRTILVPKAFVVTPNLFEASQLAQMKPLTTIEEMKKAASKIHALGAKHVVIKGGAKINYPMAVDLYYDGQEFVLLENEKIDTTFTHGAGCTFAASICANLANGKSTKEAVELAKKFTASAIKNGFALNEFVGPTRHSAYFNNL